MDEGVVLTRCVDSLEIIAQRLKELNNMIIVISLGMQQENMEQQAVDCVETIGHCVNDLKNVAADRLRQVKNVR